MIKQIYFGEYSPQDLVEMGITTPFTREGRYFEYELILDTDEGTLNITDSLKRMVPFDITAFEALDAALGMALHINALAQEATDLNRFLNDESSTVTGIIQY